MKSRPPDGETFDDLLQGRLRILQKVGGFRYSIDALLLARFAGEAIEGRKPGSVRALDLGSGTGVIPLVLSCYPAIASVTGLEIVPPLVEMSRRSVELNGLCDKITIIEGDIRNPPADLKPDSFDLIVSNPPYRRKGAGKLNPDRHRAMARHEIAVSLKDILKTTSQLIKRRGLACFIYGAFRMTDIVTGLRDSSLEPARLRYIHSRENEPAKMLLIESRESGPPEIIIASPLIVYRDKENYTEEVLKIFKGPEDRL